MSNIIMTQENSLRSLCDKSLKKKNVRWSNSLSLMDRFWFIKILKIIKYVMQVFKIICSPLKTLSTRGSESSGFYWKSSSDSYWPHFFYQSKLIYNFGSTAKGDNWGNWGTLKFGLKGAWVGYLFLFVQYLVGLSHPTNLSTILFNI